jgi:DNA-binding MarR family transcriptional regulator
VVESLAADHLISRAENPRDGRSKLVSITADGMAVVRKIQPILDTERQYALADLDDAEMELSADVLQRIFRRLTQP